MPYTVEALHVGDGVTTQFGFNFDYQKPAHVIVSVDGVGVAYTLLSPNTVQITPAPGAGASVRIYRDTPLDTINHQFQLGAPFLPAYIDDNNLQVLYAAQESRATSDKASAAASAAVASAVQANLTADGAVAVANTSLSTANAASTASTQAVATATAALNTANGIAGTAATALSTAVAADAKAEAALEAVGESGVASFAGRSGVVLPQSGDYTASMVARGVSTVDADLSAVEVAVSTVDANLSAVEVAVATLDQTKVEQTSSTGAAKLPTGSTAQRPTPESGLVRFNSDTQEFEGYDGEEWGALGSSDAGVPLFAVMWWSNRATIPGGYVAADGQTLSRATYPDAWAGVQAGNVPIVADATWLSTPTERGKFTAGDGSTTFRIPDYNGKSAGSLGAVFLRGDGALSATTAGVIQRDALQAHLHGLTTGWGNAYGPAVSSTNEGLGPVVSGRQPGSGTNQTARQMTTLDYVADGSAGTPRTAVETRPLNVTGCWVVKLYGEVVNTGAADAAQLASDYANLAGRVGSLEGGSASIGTGQSWQDVTAARAFGITYTNTTGRTIAVSVWPQAQTSRTYEIVVDGIVLGSLSYGSANVAAQLFAVVPPGATYRVNNPSGGSTIGAWVELR